MTTRTVTGTVYEPDGTAWASGAVTFSLVEGFTTATLTQPTESIIETTDAAGQFTVTLSVPDTGTAHYFVTLPDHRRYEFYLATGAPVDLATLITIAGTAVAQSDLQTLLDAAAVFDITNITGTYGMDGTEEYIRCDGTFTVTLPAATGSGLAYALKNIGSGTITLARAGTDTIDGATSQTLYALDKLAVLDAAAGKWDVL